MMKRMKEERMMQRILEGAAKDKAEIDEVADEDEDDIDEDEDWSPVTGGSLGKLIALLNTACPSTNEINSWKVVGGFAVYLYTGQGTYDDLDISIDPGCFDAVRTAVFGAADAAEHLPEMHDATGAHEVTLLTNPGGRPAGIETITHLGVAGIRVLSKNDLLTNYKEKLEIKYAPLLPRNILITKKRGNTKNAVVQKLCGQAKKKGVLMELPKDIKRLKRVWALRLALGKGIPPGDLTASYEPCEFEDDE
jgi:hypothetical protein